MELKFVRSKDFWEKKCLNIIKTELLYLHATAEHRQLRLTNFTYDAISIWSDSNSILEFESKLEISFNRFLKNSDDSFEHVTELADTYEKIKATASVFRIFLDRLEYYFEKLKTDKEDLILDILTSHLFFIHTQASKKFKEILLTETSELESFKMLTSFYSKKIPKKNIVAEELVDLMYDILNWTVTLYGELLESQLIAQNAGIVSEDILEFVRETGTQIYFYLYFSEDLLNEFNIGEEIIDELLEYENDKWNEIRGYANIDNIKTHLLNN